MLRAVVSRVLSEDSLVHTICKHTLLYMCEGRGVGE